MPLEGLLEGRIPWGPAVGEDMAGARARACVRAAVARPLTCGGAGGVCPARIERAARRATGEWRDEISDVGEVYFWHTGTRQTTFAVPEGFRDRGTSSYRRFVEQMRQGAGAAKGATAATTPPPPPAAQR